MKLLPFYLEEPAAKYRCAVRLSESIEYFSVEEAALLSGYMESCIVIESWISNVDDVLTKKFMIPAKTWSDGVYAWDSSHIYYLKSYRARLPNEFVEHVRRQIETGFDPKKNLVKAKLHAEYQNTLQKIVDGNDSLYANYAEVSCPK
jgi:hypothetical protein